MQTNNLLVVRYSPAMNQLRILLTFIGDRMAAPHSAFILLS